MKKIKKYYLNGDLQIKKNKLDIGYITGMYNWGDKISKEHNPTNDGIEWGIEITFDDFEYFVLNKNKLQEYYY